MQFPLDSGKKEKEDSGSSGSGATSGGNSEGGGGSLLISNNVRILPREQLQVISLWRLSILNQYYLLDTEDNYNRMDVESDAYPFIL